MYHPNLEPHQNYKDLQNLNQRALAYLGWEEEKLLEIKPETSGWSIAHHLYHLALSHGSIPRLIERLQSGRLGEEGLESRPDMVKLIEDGIILRGRKSPDATNPPDGLNKELLARDLERMTKATQRLEPMLDELHAIPRKFLHLYYGPLNALEWLRFMGMHCRHHLGIVEEIENAT